VGLSCIGYPRNSLPNRIVPKGRFIALSEIRIGI
jgi:hypothetical protein